MTKKAIIFQLIAILILSAICVGCTGNNSSEENNGSGSAAIVPEVPGKEIVKINDSVITAQQLHEYMIILATNAKKKLGDFSETELEDFRESTLENMLTNTVIRQYLEGLGPEQMTMEIFNSAQQIASMISANTNLTNLVKNNEIAGDTLQLYIDFCSYADWFYLHVMETTDLSDQAVKAYFEANKKDMIRTQVVAAHILVAKSEEAEEILKKLGNGEDFADLAAEFSKDTGSKNYGGVLPDFGRNETYPEFEEAVFSMELGEIRGPVRTDLGYHIIRLDEKYITEVDLEDATAYIQDVLIREACNEKIRELRAAASIIFFE